MAGLLLRDDFEAGRYLMSPLDAVCRCARFGVTQRFLLLRAIAAIAVSDVGIAWFQILERIS
jgi:hypothetical protein